jgi:hypothetical protein
MSGAILFPGTPADSSAVCALNPSGDTTGNTDTQVIQGQLSSGAVVVRLGAGQFYVNQALTLSTGQMLIGSGMDNTVINQLRHSASGLTMTDQRYVAVRDLQLKGPGASVSTGHGIAFMCDKSPLASLDLENLRILRFGGCGVYLMTPITSVLRNVRVESCGEDHFCLTGGTSCTIDSCYANGTTGGTQNGFKLNAMGYTTLNSCAADAIIGDGTGGGAGYLVSGHSTGITFNSCGNERSAIGFKITGSQDVVLNACQVYKENTYAYVITSNSVNVTLLSCRERSPSGTPHASIQVNTGSAAVVINPDVVTGAVYATGTAYSITRAGGVTH